jgi:hypothetical protein
VFRHAASVLLKVPSVLISSKAVWAPLIFVVIDLTGEVEEVVNAGKNLAKDDVYGYGSDVAAAIIILLLPKRIEYSNRLQGGLKVGVDIAIYLSTAKQANDVYKILAIMMGRAVQISAISHSCFEEDLCMQ